MAGDKCVVLYHRGVIVDFFSLLFECCENFQLHKVFNCACNASDIVGTRVMILTLEGLHAACRFLANLK